MDNFIEAPAGEYWEDAKPTKDYVEAGRRLYQQKITKCPTRKSVPNAPSGMERNPVVKPKRTRAYKKLIRQQEQQFRDAMFKARGQR